MFNMPLAQWLAYESVKSEVISSMSRGAYSVSGTGNRTGTVQLVKKVVKMEFVTRKSP